MAVSSKCAEPWPKKTDARSQFAFLGRSAAGRRMTAEDELEWLSGSGHLSTLALRRTSSWTSVPPSCMSLDAWLAASGATWAGVWRWFNLLAGRRPWLGCSALAAVLRKSQLVHRRSWQHQHPIHLSHLPCTHGCWLNLWLNSDWLHSFKAHWWHYCFFQTIKHDLALLWPFRP